MGTRYFKSTHRHIHTYKIMKKYINRFYVVIAIIAIMMFSCITSNNVYQNAFMVGFAFLFYIVAMAYLLDDSQKETYTQSERKLIDWVNSLY